MKSVRVEDAVGMVLAHDLTKIIPGQFKGAAFKKGHIISPQDIEDLKDAGKYNVYVVSLNKGQVHENTAAERLAAASCGDGVYLCDAVEGKVNIKAASKGVLKINREALYEINSFGEIALVTRHNNSPVEKDTIVAGSKIIPLTIDLEKLKITEEFCLINKPIIEVRAFEPLGTSVIITGSEVYYGRIRDSFAEILKMKVSGYGGRLLSLDYAPDDLQFITGLIKKALTGGAEIILVSGGMAVDADDVTPNAIKASATSVITYGVPLLPGAMCMLAYYNDIPIVGIPACAMFHKTTVLDLIYPRLLTGERLSGTDIQEFAHGGLCLNCSECCYPLCPFGK